MSSFKMLAGTVSVFAVGLALGSLRPVREARAQIDPSIKWTAETTTAVNDLMGRSTGWSWSFAPTTIPSLRGTLHAIPAMSQTVDIADALSITGTVDRSGVSSYVVTVLHNPPMDRPPTFVDGETGQALALCPAR